MHKKGVKKAVDQNQRATNYGHDEHACVSLQQTCVSGISEKRSKSFSKTAHNFLPRINYSTLEHCQSGAQAGKGHCVGKKLTISRSL